LAKDHVIKGAIRVIGQAFVHVPLQHREATADAASHPLFRELHASPPDALFGQKQQQLAIATAQVKDRGLRMD